MTAKKSPDTSPQFTSDRLAEAVWHGNVQAMQEMVDDGADVNQEDDYGYLPLILAVQQGSMEMVCLLLERGAIVSKKSRDGHTALNAAVMNNDEELARLLLDKGALINETGLNGFTPLIQAAICGSGNIICLLLQKGADPEVKDTGGCTAMAWAIKNEDTEAQQALKNALDACRRIAAEKAAAEAAAVAHAQAVVLQERLKNRPGYKMKIVSAP
jgi:ankyrin repeat protein